MGHFAPVRINETLTLDFDNWDHFDIAPLRLPCERRGVRCDLSAGSKRQVFRMGAVRSRKRICRSITGAAVAGIYFKDPNGHLLELLTRA